MTTVTEAGNPKTAADLNLMPSTTVDESPTQPPPASGEGGDESKVKPDDLVKASNGDSASEVTDVQKKMKRAERFGMTVQLSEEEKRNSRAERFGTGSTVNGSDSPKQAEELKKKARAERFGIVKSAPADEEVKKKARLSRFGSSAHNDPIDEEKKKARAIRFSEQGAGTKSNGNENINVKLADTSKADGAT